MEGDVRTVEQAFAVTGLSDLPRPAQIDPAGDIQPLQIDDGQRIVQRIGHPSGSAIGRDPHAAGAVRRLDVLDDELGRLAHVIGQDALALLVRRLPDHADHLLQVDHGDAVGSGTGDQRQIPVGRDGNAGRIGKSHRRLVQQHLVDAAVPPHHAKAVGDRPALQQPSHRNKVLGAVHGDQAVLAARMPIDTDHQIRAGNLQAVLDHRALGVDDGHFGQWGLAERHEAGQRVGHQDLRAVRRQRQCPRIATGLQPLDLFQRLGVDDGNAVGRRVQHVQQPALAVGQHAVRFVADRDGGDGLASRHVDHRHRVVQTVADIGPAAAGMERDVVRLAADRDFGDLGLPSDVDHGHCVGGLACHVQFASAGVERHVLGRLVSHFLGRWGQLGWVQDLLPSGLDVERLAVRVGVTAQARIVRDGLQSGQHRGLLVPHDGFGRVAAAGAVAGLAADAFEQGVTGFRAAGRVVICGGMAFQASRGGHRIAIDPGLPGDFARLAGGQRRIGVGVTAAQPAAVLIAALRTAVALAASVRTRVPRLRRIGRRRQRDRFGIAPVSWRGMRDGLPRFFEVELRRPEHRIVRALAQVARAAVFLGRDHQPGCQRGFAIHHHGLVHVFAARPVAFLALHTVLQLERIFPFPCLGLGAGRMAAQTDRRLLRLDRHAAQAGDLLRLGRRQRGIRLGMFRQPPQTLLVSHTRPGVALGAFLVAHEVRVLSSGIPRQQWRHQAPSRQPREQRDRRRETIPGSLSMPILHVGPPSESG